MFRKDFHFHSAAIDGAILILLGAGLMGWLAPQVWTIQEDLPITPQSLLVVLWSVLWGWEVGLCAVLIYLFMGGMGLPVFAGGASGWHHFTGSTSGFLQAFPITALITGWIAKQARRFRYGTSAILLLSGQFLIVVIGLYWLRAIVQPSESLLETISHLAPAILVKTAIGTLVVVMVGRVLTGHRNQKEVDP